MNPARRDALPEARAPARRRWDGMTALIVGIFALVIGVNGAMLWFTLLHPPQLVSASYYEDARVFNREMEAGRDSAATGWRVGLAQDGKAGAGNVSLTVADARGRPVTGLVGRLRAYRPSDEALDQEMPLTERPGAPGRYEARLPNPRPGRWELIVTLRKGDARLAQSIAWVAP